MWSKNFAGAGISETEQTGNPFISLKRIKYFLNHLPLSAIVITRDGAITWCNPGAEELYGYSCGKMLSSSFTSYLPEESSQQLSDLRQKVSDEGAVSGLKGSRRHQDGSIFSVSFSAMPLMEEDRGEDLLCLLEKPDMAGANSHPIKDSDCTRLARCVGHEIRSPLTAIQNAVSLLRMSIPSPSEEVNEILDIISIECRATNIIASSLTDLARLKQPKPENISIRDAFQQSLNGLPKPENIQIREEYLARNPHVYADHCQLQQIFRNLIRNAMEAMPEGGNLIFRVKTDHGSGHMEMSFEDNGHGIRPEVKNRLFEPFFTTKAYGTGMGLYISRKLVQDNGGSLNYETTPDNGTTFHLSLPGNESSRREDTKV